MVTIGENETVCSPHDGQSPLRYNQAYPLLATCLPHLAYPCFVCPNRAVQPTTTIDRAPFVSLSWLQNFAEDVCHNLSYMPCHDLPCLVMTFHDIVAQCTYRRMAATSESRFHASNLTSHRTYVLPFRQFLRNLSEEGAVRISRCGLVR